MPNPRIPTPPNDAVRAKRAEIAKWTLLANRIGYACWLVAMVVFFIGFAAGFNDLTVGIVVGAMIAGTVILAPALVVGYGLGKAEREDPVRP